MGGILVEFHHPFGGFFPTRQEGCLCCKDQRKHRKKTGVKHDDRPTEPSTSGGSDILFDQKIQVKWGKSPAQNSFEGFVQVSYDELMQEHTSLLLAVTGYYWYLPQSKAAIPQKRSWEKQQVQPIPINGSTVESLERTPVINVFYCPAAADLHHEQPTW